jgi:hypothetical protein
MPVTGVNTVTPDDRIAGPVTTADKDVKPQPVVAAPVNVFPVSGDSKPSPPIPQPKAGDPRTVVVILPGFSSGIGGESSADYLRDSLLAQGIPPENIVVPPSHYPSFNENVRPEPPPDYSRGYVRGAFSWLRNRVRNLCVQGYNLYRNVRLYTQYTDPNSAESRRAYQDVHDRLNLAPGQQVNLNFVGYSGGGQEAVTLARMAEDDPRVRSVRRVITIGSPMMVNQTRPEVEITSYVSPDDGVLNRTAMLPLVRYTPPNTDGNDQVRTYNAHHTQYYVMPEVMRQLYQDLTVNQEPLILPAPRPNPAPAPLPTPEVADSPVSLLPGVERLQAEFLGQSDPARSARFQVA